MPTAATEPRYPLFRNKFFGGALWLPQAATVAPPPADEVRPASAQQGSHPPGSGDSSCVPAPIPAVSNHLQRPILGIKLDLKSLPRDDGPPSETQLRRQKFKHFEKQCSEVSDRIYVSGDQVARSAELLSENGITHVVNCVGFICKEYHPDLATYKTLFLQDTPAEDILCVLYDTFEFMETALHGGGKVLVHCSQGVSRSATIAIGYLMWKFNRSYDETFAMVKEARGVVNPNIGFTCQLLQWHKRRKSGPSRVRMYRIAPHSAHAPKYMVPKVVTPPKLYPNNTYRELDPRGAFIIQTPSQLYVWRGSRCPALAAAAAEYHAKLLPKYEAGGVSMPLHLVDQGNEPQELLSLLDPPVLDPEAARINARRASITGDILLSSSPCMQAPEGLQDGSVGGGSVCGTGVAAGEAGTPNGSVPGTPHVPQHSFSSIEGGGRRQAQALFLQQQQALYQAAQQQQPQSQQHSQHTSDSGTAPLEPQQQHSLTRPPSWAWGNSSTAGPSPTGSMLLRPGTARLSIPSYPGGSPATTSPGPLSASGVGGWGVGNSSMQVDSPVSNVTSPPRGPNAGRASAAGLMAAYPSTSSTSSASGAPPETLSSSVPSHPFLPPPLPGQQTAEMPSLSSQQDVSGGGGGSHSATAFAAPASPLPATSPAHSSKHHSPHSSNRAAVSCMLASPSPAHNGQRRSNGFGAIESCSDISITDGEGAGEGSDVFGGPIDEMMEEDEATAEDATDQTSGGGGGGGEGVPGAKHDVATHLVVVGRTWGSNLLSPDIASGAAHSGSPQPSQGRAFSISDSGMAVPTLLQPAVKPPRHSSQDGGAAWGGGGSSGHLQPSPKPSIPLPHLPWSAADFGGAPSAASSQRSMSLQQPVTGGGGFLGPDPPRIDHPRRPAHSHGVLPPQPLLLHSSSGLSIYAASTPTHAPKWHVAEVDEYSGEYQFFTDAEKAEKAAQLAAATAECSGGGVLGSLNGSRGSSISMLFGSSGSTCGVGGALPLMSRSSYDPALQGGGPMGSFSMDGSTGSGKQLLPIPLYLETEGGMAANCSPRAVEGRSNKYRRAASSIHEPSSSGFIAEARGPNRWDDHGRTSLHHVILEESVPLGSPGPASSTGAAPDMMVE